VAEGQLTSGGLDREALASARRAVELDPENAATQAILARVLFIGFGEFEQAADCFARAIALNPEAGWYALQLAHCALLTGQLDRAEQAARQALVLQEGFLSGRQGLAIVGAYVRLGQVAVLRGRPLDGVELYRREEEFVRRISHALGERILIEIRYRIGSALLAAGRPEEARPELEAAVSAHEQRVRLGGDDPFTRYYSACARSLLGDHDGAAADLERAIAARRAYVVRRVRTEPDLAAVAPRILEAHAPVPDPET
jgi:tetratricopeptide (TPR) repeat protein